MRDDDPRRWFWRRTRRLTAALLLAWLGINLGTTWFARELSTLSAFGFPLGYWLAAQGSLGLYLLVIVIYVLAMERLEARYLDAVDPLPPAPSASGDGVPARSAAPAPPPSGHGGP